MADDVEIRGNVGSETSAPAGNVGVGSSTSPSAPAPVPAPKPDPSGDGTDPGPLYPTTRGQKPTK